jgi:hypothetical protein
MAFANKRLIAMSIALAVILAAGLIIAAVTLFPYNTNLGSSATSRAGSLQTRTSNQAVTSQSSTVLGTTISVSIDASACPANCTLNLPWPTTYDGMSALVSASDYIGLANVTAVSTDDVAGVPLLVYNITVIQNLVQDNIVSAGSNLTVAQIGGTANGITMQVGGYPTLVVGHTYVFFLQQTETYLIQYYGLYPVTVGGPQGLFYVQNGKVFSLDNMYPQADSWLPVKAAGVPLAQFIQEVQSASTSSTSTLIG